jgi:dihydroneopterin triphosphate diphosphatase
MLQEMAISGNVVMPRDKKKPAPGSVPLRSSLVSAYVYKKEGDVPKFLVLKRKSRYMFGLWQQVAGKIEEGETAVQAVLREIKEETGLYPRALYSVDIIESFYDMGHNCIHLIPVFAAEFLPKARVVLSPEHSEYKWLSLAEAKKCLIFSQQKTSIDEVALNFIKKEPLPQLRIEF